MVIAVDASRTVVSRRAARRYHSPAFGANALHFASDLAGSTAVLVGMVLVAAGEQWGDSAAALFVAGLVVLAALRLAGQSVDVLMDRAATDAGDRIREALAALHEPVELRRLRVRHAAGRHFVDLVVGVASDAGVTQAHATADLIEDAVGRELEGADVVVHVEPVATPGDLRERATAAASAAPEVREVHNVRVMHLPDGYELSLHVKLPRELSLTEAHDVVEGLEQRVRAELPELRDVHTHIEPLSGTDWAHPAGERRDRGGAPRDRGRGARRDRQRARPDRLSRRRAGPRGAGHGLPPGRPAAALGPPARGGHRGGGARALPRPGGRDRPHRAGRRYSRLTAAAAPTASRIPE